LGSVKTALVAAFLSRFSFGLVRCGLSLLFFANRGWSLPYPTAFLITRGELPVGLKSLQIVDRFPFVWIGPGRAPVSLVFSKFNGIKHFQHNR
jgi:hypothetical protein